MSETPEERERLLNMQKTCFIFTVNLGHIDSKLDWSLLSEDEQIEELEAHWEHLCSMPNLTIGRGQIERNKSGVLHINGGLKFGRVWRARTLENKGRCWARPAKNEQAVLNYGKKQDTRVKELENFGTKKAKKPSLGSPKQNAIDMLLAGKTPVDICQEAPDVFFTHHRAILETWKMLQVVKTTGRRMAIDEEE